MAKGGGKMSFTGGTYNAGKIVIDANEALKAANDLDAALQRVGSTLTNLSKGRDVSALWNAQAASIENVVQALEQFKRNTESVGNAEGLVKAMNAFSAWHPDENISSYFDRMGDGAQALIDKAKQLAVNLDSAFNVSSLRESFQVFDMLKSAGVDLEQIFAKLRAGDVSTLTQQVETLERQLTHTKYRAQELQAQVDQFQSGNAFAEMQEKINQYESAMERAKSEFRSFLSASGFAGDDLDEYYGRFSDLFERISNGSLTVKEAMAQVREEYSHMFQSAGADQILEIMTRLESLGTALEGIKETLANMGMANSGSASLGEMREYLVQGADAASHQREELAQLSAQSASLQGLIDVLARLSQANAEADTGMSGVHQSIVELLSSVQSLGQIDVGNLQQVSDILRSFVKMDGISVGKASVQNLVSAFESLSRLPSTSSLSGLAAIDFSNLSNLKVSKAALSNLAEFLPSISGINVGPLQQLASIDWTNLSNLKVSKASLSNLSEMAQTTGLSPDTSGFTSIQSAVDKIGTSLDGLQEKIRTTFDLSNAISQASELANQYAGVKTALDSVAAASKRAGSAGGSTGQGKQKESAELKELIGLYQQYYALESKKISAVHKGDIDNADVYRARANAIWEQIAGIEELNPKLAELAGRHEKVTEAVRNWQAAVNSGQNRSDSVMAKRAQEDTKALEAYQKMIETYRKEVESLSAGFGTSGIGSTKLTGNTAALSEYKDALAELQSRFNAIGTAAENEKAIAISAFEAQKRKVEELRAALIKSADAQARANTLAGKIELYASKNGAAPLAMRQQWQQWINELKNGEAVANGTLNSIATGFANTTNQIKIANIGGKTFFQQMQEGWRKFGGWSIVTRTFTTVIRLFKQAVTAVKEVDAAMTELKKITSLTASEYEAFGEKASQISKAIGASLADTINATADFARLGYDVGDATELAKVALIYKNVGYGVDTITDATESLISTIKAFGIQAEDAMFIVDKFNEVGNHFAISSGGIGEALQRSASAMYAAGNSIDEAIGLVVAANDVVQNPEVVGTALKTLTLYMRAAKTEAEEAGIETEGMATSVSKLRDELMALTNGRLDIQIDENNFKSTFQILKELSVIWDDLTDMTQANILGLIGSKRNANVVVSILKNFQDAEAAAATAAKSAGSAFAENEKFLQSINGKAQQVTASFQSFANAVLNSGVVKAFMDIQKGILDISTALSKVNALAPTVMTLFTAIKTFRDNMAANTAIRSMANIFAVGEMRGTEFAQLTRAADDVMAKLTPLQRRIVMIGMDAQASAAMGSAGFAQYAATMQGAGVATNAMATAQERAKLATNNLGNAMKTLTTSVSFWLTVATLVVSAIRSIVDGYRKAEEDAINSAKEIREAFTEHTADYENDIKTLESLRSEYDALNAKAGEHGKQGSLNAEEYDRYKEIIQQIVDISPSVVASFTDEGVALRDYKGVIDEAIGAQKELLANEKLILVSKADKVYEGARKEVSKLYDEMKKAASAVRQAVVPAEDDLIAAVDGTLEKQRESFEKVLEAVNVELPKLGLTAGGFKDYSFMKDLYDNLQNIVTAMRLSGDYTAEEIDRIKAAIAGYGPILEKYSGYIKEVQDVLLAFSDTSEEVANAFPNYDDMNIEQLHYYQEGIRGIADATKSFSEQKEEVIAFAVAFSQALRDIDFAKSAEDEQQLEQRWGDLSEKWKGQPVILKMIEAALFGVTEAENTNAEATKELTNSYSNLEKILSKISSFNNFLNNARSKDGDPFGMISAAKELADAYNEVMNLPDDQKIDWTSMTSGTGKNGEIIWSTTAIEQYINAIIDASVANTEFANEHPEVVKFLQGVATAATEAKDDVDEYKNALSDLSTVSKYLTGGVDTTDTIQTIADMEELAKTWNDTLKVLGRSGEANKTFRDFITIDDSGNIINDAQKLTDALKLMYTDIANAAIDLDETLNDEEKTRLKSAIPSIIQGVIDGSQKAKEKVFELADAMDALEAIRSFRINATDEDADYEKIYSDAQAIVDAVNNAIDAGQLTGMSKINLGDLVYVDENGLQRNLDTVESYVQAMVDMLIALMQAQGVSMDGVDLEALKKELTDYYKGVTTAATSSAGRAATAIRNANNNVKKALTLSDILGDINNAVDFSKFNAAEKGLEDLADIYDKAIQLRDMYNEAMSRGLVSGVLDTSEHGGGLLDGLFGWIDGSNTPEGKVRKIKLSDILTFDNDGPKLASEYADQVRDAMVEEMIKDYEGDEKEKARAYWTQYFEYVLSGSEEPIDKFKDNLSSLRTSLDFIEELRNYRDGDKSGVLSLIEKAYDLAKNMEGVELTDIISFDGGELKFAAQSMDVFAQNMAETLAVSLKLNESMTDEEYKVAVETLTQILKDAAQESEKPAKTFADNLDDISTALTYLGENLNGAAVRDGLRGALESFYSMRDKFGDDTWKLSDFFSFDKITGELVYQTDFLKTVVENQASSLAGEIAKSMFEAGEISEEEISAATEKIKEALLQSGEEVEDTFGDINKRLNTASTLSGFLTDVQSGDNGAIEMLKSAITLAEELGLTLDQVVTVSDGELVFSTDTLTEHFNTYVDNLVSAGKLNSEIAEVIKEQARAEAEVANNAKDYSEALKGISTASSFASAMRDMESGDKGVLDTLNSIVSLAETFGLELENAYVIADGKLQPNIGALRTGFMNYIDQLVQSGVLTQELADQIKQAAIEESKLAEEAKSYSDVMARLNAVGTLSGFLTDLQSGDKGAVDMLKTAVSLAEELGLDLNQVVTVSNGELVFSTETLVSGFNKYIDELVSAGKLNAEIAAVIKEQAKAEAEVANYTKDYSEALKGISTASSFVSAMRDMESGDKGVLDTLNSIVSLAETFGLELENAYIIVDGKLQPNIGALRTGFMNYIDQLVQSGVLTEELAEHIKKAAIEESRLAEEAENYSDITARLNAVETLSGFLTDMQSGDKGAVDMLKTAVALAEELGLDLNQVVTASNGGLVFSTDVLVAGFNKYVDDLVDAGKLNADIAAIIKEQAKAEAEVASNAKDYSDVLNGISTASSFVSAMRDMESGEKGVLDTLNSVVTLAETFGLELQNAYVVVDGKLQPNIGALRTGFMNYIDQLVQSGVLTEELAEHIKKAAIEESRLAEEAESYSDITARLNAVGTLSGFLTDLQSGDKGAVDMLKTAVALAEELGLDLNQVVTASNGELVFSTDSLVAGFNKYVDDLVSAGKLNADIAAIIKEQAKAEAEVANSAKDYSEALKGISTASSFVSAMRDMESGDKGVLDTLNSIVSLSETFGLELENAYLIVDGKLQPNIGALRTGFMNYIDSLVDSGVLTEELAEHIKKAAIEESKLAEEAKSYSDVMARLNAVGTLSGFLTDLQSGDKGAVDMLKTAVSLAEELGLELGHVVTASGGNLVFSTDALIAGFNKYVDDLVTAGKLNADIAAIIKEQAKAEAEVVSNAKDYSDILKGVSTASSFVTAMRNMESGDKGVLDTLNSVVSLAETFGLELENAYTIVDGKLQPNIGALRTGFMNYIDQLVQSGVLTQELADQIKNAAIEESKLAEEAKSYSDITARLNAVGTLSGFLTDLQSGDKGAVDMLKTAVSLAEELNLDLNRVVSVSNGGLVFSTDTLLAGFNKYVDDLVTAGKLNADIAAVIKEQAKAEAEVANYAKDYSEALKGISTASSFVSSIRDMQSGQKGVLDTLNSIVSLAETFGLEIENTYTIVDGKLQPNIGALRTGFSNYIDQLVTSGVLTAELAAIIKQAAIEESKLAEEAENYSDITARLNAVDSIGTFLTNLQSGDKGPIEMLKSAVALAEELGLDLNNVVTVTNGALSFSTTTLVDGFERYVDELVTAGKLNADIAKIIKEQAAAEKELEDSYRSIGEAYEFMSEHAAGARVEDISKLYEDLTTLRKLAGDSSLEIIDFVQWDDDIGDFVYKTDLLSGKIDELATKIATEMVDAEIAAGNAMSDALRSDEIAKRANAIKNSFGEVIDTWGKLTSAVNNVKSLQSLRSDYGSYLSGDMSFLEMLSNTISLAETLGLSLDEALSVDSDGEMVVNIENMENGLIGFIDSLEESGQCTANLAAQLRNAVRAEIDLASDAERIQHAYENFSAAAGFGNGRSRGQQLTYEDYKSMIERDARYAETVQYVNGVMSVNVDLYNQITSAIAQETAEMALLEAAQRKLKYEALEKELKTRRDLTDDVRSSMQKEIDKLKLEAKGYMVLANEIANATNQFERFRAAAGDADADTYMDAKTALKMIQDVMYNMESEIYGQYGNEKFKEAIRLLIDPEFDFEHGDLEAAVAKAYAVLEKYFGEGSEKNPQTSRSNMFSFWQDLVAKGFGTVDENGFGHITGNVEDIAKAFGMTKDAARAALQELEKWSQTPFDWEAIDPEYYENVIKKAEDLAKAAEDAKAQSEELTAKADEARAKADEAAKKLEEAKKSGDETTIKEAEAEAKVAEENAQAAEKARDEANQAAEKAAQASEEAKMTETDKFKKSLEEILADVEAIKNERLDIDTTGAVQSTQNVIDNLEKMAKLLGEMNSINGSGGEGNTGSNQGVGGKPAEAKVPIRIIASAGVSDVGGHNITTDGKIDYRKLAQEYIPEDYDGNVDLTRRVIVPVSALAEVGWTGIDENGNEVDLSTEGGWATLFSNTITAGDTESGYEIPYHQNVVFDATPILADGTPLSPDSFWNYLESIIGEAESSGKTIQEVDAENLGLILKVDVVQEGESVDDAINQMVEWCIKLHELQEEWDLISFENNWFGEGDKVDPNGVFEDMNNSAKTVQDSVDTLSGTKIETDAQTAVTNVEGLDSAVKEAQSKVDTLKDSSITTSAQGAINNVGILNGSLLTAISRINTLNSMSIRPRGGSGYISSGGGESGSSGAGGIANAKGGKTLVGELGREVVVDTQTGRWYTVGNNGPEFVNLPKHAIVFNHQKTAELLGDRRINLSGFSFANGGTYNNSSVRGGMINISGLTPQEKQRNKTVQHISDEVEEAVDVLEGIAEAYKLANETLEHLIEHEEFSYFKAERASNYDRMHTVLANEIEIYKAIMKNSQEGIEKLKREGADDGNEYLQELEESYWDAYRSMYDALDNIRDLYSDALNDEVDNIQGAFNTLSNAVKEYNENGHISIDTFQAILENGAEYLGLLKDENGSFDTNANAAQAILQSRKDQLAIETAIAYVNRLQESLMNKETQKTAELLAAKGEIGRSTWDIVFANLEMLKSQGLNNQQYEIARQNVEKIRDLAKVAMDDFGKDNKIEEVKTGFEDLNKEIEHYIAHQEFAFGVGERAMNFVAMNKALENEVGYYRRIMEEAQKTIEELSSLGVQDTDEALQSVEESYWSAYNNMYDILDRLRALRVDALSDRLDGLKNSFSALTKASEEYAAAGGISLDTLESLLDSGFQYMSLLDEQNGKYVISKERVNQYVNARKDQLAIESALSYISQVREALENKEDDRLQHLITTMDAVTDSTWGYVYAQAELLKVSMNETQYKTFVENIDKMKALADSVVYDYAETQGNITEEYNQQSEALDKILQFTEDLIRAENKKKIDALKDQIDAYKEIIELKKESLDTTKSENEYQDGIAEKVKELAEMQAKADLLGLDTSRTASVERQKLLQDIADKQQELAKYQQDYAIDAQKEALDKDYEAYEENKNLEIEKLENIVSSEEKVYRLAIERIREQWGTLYQDLIEWNTEEGSVINQEITDAWNEATKAVGRYGSAVAALEAFKNSSDNLIVADIPMYHSGGIVGNKGSLNENEVLAVLEKGELVVTKPMKQALYTAVDFVHELGKKLGTKLEAIRNFATGDLSSAFAPAFATPGNVPVAQNNNITFSPTFNVEFNGADIGERDAKTLGRDIASIAADNLFEAFSRRGIDSIRTLRQ